MANKNIIIFIAILAVLVFAGVMVFVTSRPIPQPPVTQPPLEPSPQGEAIDTSDWQTYRNEGYGFEVRYPSNWLSPDEAGEYVIIRNFDIYADIPENKRMNIDIALNRNWKVLGIDSHLIESIEEIILDEMPAQKIIWYPVESIRPKEILISFKDNRGIDHYMNFDGFFENSVENELFDQILSTFKFIE